MRLPVLFLIGCCLLTSPIRGEFRLGESTAIVFATRPQAQAILGREDDFIRCTTPQERAARMGRGGEQASAQDYLAYDAESAMEWSVEETARVTQALDWIAAGLAPFAEDLPATVALIKTSGREEWGNAYTRANAIILEQPTLAGPVEALGGLIAHELFHILTRHDAALRDRLYRAIGFEPCGEVELPASLRERKLTNPDAPYNDYCIAVEHEGRTVWAVPLIYSRTPQFGAELNDFVEFRLMIVERDAAGRARVAEGTGQPQLVDPMAVTGFFEKIGRNTGYIIHPEETLADNFKLLVLGRQDVPSPDVLERVRAILTGGAESSVPLQPPGQ